MRLWICADKHFWVQGYTLISKDVEDCVPIFLRDIANDVYVCGKTINLLKICCPQVCFAHLTHSHMQMRGFMQLHVVERYQCIKLH